MKITKRIICTVLAAVLLLCSAPLTGSNISLFQKAKAAAEVGDHVFFGNYPQTKETDGTVLSLLDSMQKQWISYGYYSGTGSSTGAFGDDGSMVPEDGRTFKDGIHL